MSPKWERKVARQVVAAYHELQLTELVSHVTAASDRFRAGELNAFDVDHVLFQYSRAAKELWKFCNTGDVEVTAPGATGTVDRLVGTRCADCAIGVMRRALVRGCAVPRGASFRRMPVRLRGPAEALFLTDAMVARALLVPG